jgi:hypothetical protein
MLIVAFPRNVVVAIFFSCYGFLEVATRTVRSYDGMSCDPMVVTDGAPEMREIALFMIVSAVVMR